MLKLGFVVLVSKPLAKHDYTCMDLQTAPILEQAYFSVEKKNAVIKHNCHFRSCKHVLAQRRGLDASQRRFFRGSAGFLLVTTQKLKRGL